jgi:hypothetical protein
VPPEVWADEGRRTAASFAEIAAAVVVGRDAEAAAQVALGIARAVAQGGRRVAVADLIGAVPALTPLDAQEGLLECLRDGLAVSDIGQPLADAPDVYVLPSGRGAIAERWVFESGRWERLVAGFREVDALLLLVAQAGTPGLETLIGRVDGVVAVDLPPAVVRAWPLIATVDHPEPELPPIPRTPTPASQAAVTPAPGGQRPRRKIGRWVLLGGLAAGAALWLGLQPAALSCDGLPILRDADVQPACPAGDIARADSMRQAEARATGDTAGSAAPGDTTSDSLFVLGDVVNPGDSAAALRFSVELVAANSLAGANSTLTPRGDPYPLPTVAPVVLGTAPTVWYRVMVGAWATAQEAEGWLARQRQLGLLRGSVGRVVHTPFALQLFDGPREEALVQSAQLGSEDVLVYVLETDDGRVRVLAGAFETANQAYWFAAHLRERGLAPRLAYRTGRTF